MGTSVDKSWEVSTLESGNCAQRPGPFVVAVEVIGSEGSKLELDTNPHLGSAWLG